jgi:hypothetical protein
MSDTKSFAGWARLLRDEGYAWGTRMGVFGVSASEFRVPGSKFEVPSSIEIGRSLFTVRQLVVDVRWS